MAFSNTILPAVNPVQAGGQAVSAMNNIGALQQQNLQNQVLGAQAQYAPYQSAANAMLTSQQAQWLPYQYQMQALSNPMLWMAAQQNPALQQQLTNMMSNPLGGTGIGGASKMMNVPPPQARGETLFNQLIDKLKGTPQTSQNAMQQIPGANNQVSIPGMNAIGSPQQANAISQMQPGQALTIGGSPNAINTNPAGSGSPLVPATQGGMAGAAGKMIAPYQETPYKPGTLIPDPNSPGGVISVAEPGTTQTNQTGIQGIANLRPILQDISKGAEKWLGPGEKGKLSLGSTLNQLQQQFGDLGGIPDAVKNQVGVSNKDISDYAAWHAQIAKAAETYMKARGWPQDAVAIQKVSDILEPIPGEGKEYSDRVNQELSQLEQQVLPTYQKTLSGGFNLPSNAPSANAPAANTPAATGVNRLSKNLTLPNFNSKEQFQQWYAQQDPMTQQAVRVHLGNQ